MFVKDPHPYMAPVFLGSSLRSLAAARASAPPARIAKRPLKGSAASRMLSMFTTHRAPTMATGLRKSSAVFWSNFLS